MNERLNHILQDSKTVPVSVGIVSFVLGIGTGLGINYIRNKRKTVLTYGPPEATKYDHEAMQEFIETHEKRLGITPPVKDEEETTVTTVIDGEDDRVKDFLETKLEEGTVIVPEPEVEADESVQRSIFAGSDDEWDYDEEVKNRSSDQPYVLHKDEFYENELDYSQSSLTYYAGDDILVDEDDKPIYNHTSIVGPMRFGHGSGDPNVFHIRNDKMHAEYEIIRDPGMYSREVLGLEIEDNQRAQDLRHSHQVPRFHMD
jgi:hypothetical protein